MTNDKVTRRVISVLDVLETLWHNEERPPELRHEEPLDGLVLTILSQNTNDKNRDSAFRSLKQGAPTWDAAALLDADALAALIRTAGLAPTKAARILFILERIKQDWGAYSLKKLRGGMTGDEVRDYLLALPGIGAKTTACVMLFDLGLPAFPVDTHITRVCRRIGLVPSNTSPEAIQQFMQSRVPRERYLGSHVNIIEHGRGICRARGPQCGECAALSLCDYGAQTEKEK